MDKKTIYDLLKKNSEAFVKKENKHISGFRKAQSYQKKNLDWMMNANHSVTLAPIQSKRSTAEEHNRTSSPAMERPTADQETIKKSKRNLMSRGDPARKS